MDEGLSQLREEKEKDGRGALDKKDVEREDNWEGNERLREIKRMHNSGREMERGINRGTHAGSSRGGYI